MTKYIILTRKPLKDLKIKTNLKHHIVDPVLQSDRHSLLPLTQLKMPVSSARSLQKWEISRHVIFHVNPCWCGFIVTESSSYPSVIIPCIKQAIEFQPVVSALSPHLLTGAKHFLSEQTVVMNTPVFPLSPFTQVNWPDIWNLCVRFQDISIKDKSSGTVHSLELSKTELGFCRHTEVSMETWSLRKRMSFRKTEN